MAREQEPRELLSLRRMAARLGVPSQWLKEQAEAGSVPGLKAGERWLFKPDVVAAAVSKMAAPSAKRRELDSTTILNLLAVCDGHSILSPAELMKLGMPGDACERLSETFKSDPNTPGGMIGIDGEPVAELRGVLGLDVLAWLAQEVGADTSGVMAFGRGTRAEQFKAAILATIGGEQ
jgi:hypothetical protein